MPWFAGLHHGIATAGREEELRVWARLAGDPTSHQPPAPISSKGRKRKFGGGDVEGPAETDNRGFSGLLGAGVGS